MKDPSYRINGFEQIKAFYSWVFSNAQKRVTPQHISLYLFLINQNNRNNWVEWFKCPFDLAMAGACIGNKKTYYNCLNDLSEWGLIKYEKGTNEYKSPLIKIEVLKCTSDETAEVPQSEPLLIPQDTNQPTPLPTHIYKLITDNLKPITDNFKKVEKFILDLSKEKEKNYSFVSSEFSTSFFKWMNYKSARKEKYKSIESEQEFYNKLVKLSGNNPIIAEEIIKQSMGNNWAGIFELKSHNNGTNQSIIKQGNYIQGNFSPEQYGKKPSGF